MGKHLKQFEREGYVSNPAGSALMRQPPGADMN